MIFAILKLFARDCGNQFKNDTSILKFNHFRLQGRDPGQLVTGDLLEYYVSLGCLIGPDMRSSSLLVIRGSVLRRCRSASSPFRVQWPASAASLSPCFSSVWGFISYSCLDSLDRITFCVLLWFVQVVLVQWPASAASLSPCFSSVWGFISYSCLDSLDRITFCVLLWFVQVVLVQWPASAASLSPCFSSVWGFISYSCLDSLDRITFCVLLWFVQVVLVHLLGFYTIAFLWVGDNENKLPDLPRVA